MGSLFVITLGLALSVCATTVSANICNGYKNGAQLPNLRDCSSYYVCSYGNAALFQCKDTLLYDYHLGVCNWPENVTCASSMLGLKPITPPSDVQLLTVPPIVHYPTPQTRPPTTRQPIMTPPATTLPPSTRPPTPPRPTTVAAPTTRPPVPSTTTRQPTYPSYTVPPTYPNYPGYPGGVEGMPEVGNNQETVPPQYIEVQGQPEYVNQPEYAKTTAAQPNEQTPARTTPPAVPVTELVTTTQLFTTTTGAPQPTVVYTSTPVVDVTRPHYDDYYPGVGVAPFDPEGFVCTKDGLYFAPHADNCQEYFICENYKLHRHQCGPGVYWDFIFAQCVHAENAYCYGAPQTETTLGVTGPIAIGTISPPTQPPIVPEIVAEPLVDCPGNQAFFAHKTDCRKYYICIGGIPIATSCPEKMAWDNNNLQCSEDAEAQCLA